MPRLYIHIPFCRKACVYCDFHFSTSLKMKKEMVEAICGEIRQQQNFFGRKTSLKSIYFGGGTPSVLSMQELERIFEVIHKYFGVEKDAEITLEANPDDLSQAYLKELRQSPVNRLSIGIQSFDEEVLRWMNRSHNSRQAFQAVEDARELGFENLTADLILGLPYQSQEVWRANLDQFVNWKLPHLSVYALSVEEKTALAHQLKTGKVALPADSTFEKQYLQAHEIFTQAGYEHYELSNYALAGYKANHNSSYWNFEPYLGIGPSAHSYDGQKRHWNISNNAIFIKKIKANESPIREMEVLEKQDHYQEYLMTHLRKKEGISLAYLRKHFNPNWEKEHRLELKKWLSNGFLVQEEGKISCTPLGWMISDEIISDFF